MKYEQLVFPSGLLGTLMMLRLLYVISDVQRSTNTPLPLNPNCCTHMALL